MALSQKAQYYLAQADEYLKMAAVAETDGPYYRKLMDLAREYRNLAAIEQGVPVPTDPDGGR